MDAGVGRFAQVDPMVGNIHNTQDWNQYAYVRNDPINEIDPTGRTVGDTIDDIIDMCTGNDGGQAAQQDVDRKTAEREKAKEKAKADAETQRILKDIEEEKAAKGTDDDSNAPDSAQPTTTETVPPTSTSNHGDLLGKIKKNAKETVKKQLEPKRKGITQIMREYDYCMATKVLVGGADACRLKMEEDEAAMDPYAP
jgi:uncharacterized protein RhaS with RHS repeats